MMTAERTFTLPRTSSPIDIEPLGNGHYPIINLPLHIGEDRRIGNLIVRVCDSSYKDQQVDITFSQIDDEDFDLMDLTQETDTLRIGSIGRLACRGINGTGFVKLALCIDRTIQVNSPDRF